MGIEDASWDMLSVREDGYRSRLSIGWTWITFIKCTKHAMSVLIKHCCIQDNELNTFIEEPLEA